MPKVVEGTFRGGRVEFSHTPAAPEGARVLVTFPSEEAAEAPRMITYGEFGPSGPQGEWSDFQEAKRAIYKHIDGEEHGDPTRG